MSTRAPSAPRPTPSRTSTVYVSHTSTPAGRPRRGQRTLTAILATGLTATLGTATAVLAAANATPRAQARWAAPPAAPTSSPPAARAPAGLIPDLPPTYTIPGTPPALPWPTTGQATVGIDGLGTLGATPDQTPVPIASLTKVMTAYLVLHDHPMSTNHDGATLTVTPAEAAAYPSQVANNESLVKVTANETLTERQALEALLLPSADNIALILARWDAGTIPAFLTKMNTQAAALNMTNTHYTDPSGYDPTTRSTATDQVKLADQAMRQATLAQIVAMPTATIPVAGTIHNYNTLLGTDNITGIKTGSTSSAGGCLLFAAHHTTAGHTLTIIGAVLDQHGPTMYGLPQALTTSDHLIQATQTALRAQTAITKGQPVATVNSTTLVAADNLTILGWPGLTYHITVTTNTVELTTGDTRSSTTLAGQ